MFTFNPSTSFYVVCESEAEIESVWEKLTVGAMMKMRKIDIEEVRRAADGNSLPVVTVQTIIRL